MNKSKYHITPHQIILTMQKLLLGTIVFLLPWNNNGKWKVTVFYHNLIVIWKNASRLKLLWLEFRANLQQPKVYLAYKASPTFSVLGMSKNEMLLSMLKHDLNKRMSLQLHMPCIFSNSGNAKTSNLSLSIVRLSNRSDISLAILDLNEMLFSRRKHLSTFFLSINYNYK